MKIAYLDCVGGISGDMTLAAFIDAGADARAIVSQLKALPVEGLEIRVWEEVKGGWRGTRVSVEDGGKSQPHRHLEDILFLIRESPLPEPVKETSARVFRRLAAAEGRVHGKPPERVHFHEVGAVDSIADVVGSCLAVHLLGVEKIYCSPLPMGYGTVTCAHGVLPLPAPATAELLRGVPVRQVNVEGELVTPTGAALAVTLAADFGPLPSMRVEATGYGLGSRDYPQPNFLRVFLGQKEGAGELAAREEAVLVLETDIDDMNPELYPYVEGLLREEGALDVFLWPTLMKKGRPGTRLAVLCAPAKRDDLLRIIFRETTTLGVRARLEHRFTLQRQALEVGTPWGAVGVKVAFDGQGNALQVSPEYEDCRRAARGSGVPLKEVYRAAAQAAREKITGGSSASCGGTSQR
ncbi:nickel pincer cofactor biosynthesis protein LarC [Desulfovirgula thermocuniculi]|uniref:nickel pincer cofactor biosynthesis protein LarC n=1 Tax=Desulfovirgula thermocuniculi TaxID=348842 RepID=UPI0003FD1FBB|nr:nickel pincer cofactor biosynthesis protein LarC [Desulfovirgula thermocuniculi]